MATKKPKRNQRVYWVEEVIQYRRGYLIGTDGVRLHMAKIGLELVDGGFYLLRNNQLMEIDLVDGDFPDIEKLLNGWKKSIYLTHDLLELTGHVDGLITKVLCAYNQRFERQTFNVRYLLELFGWEPEGKVYVWMPKEGNEDSPLIIGDWKEFWELKLPLGFVGALMPKLL